MPHSAPMHLQCWCLGCLLAALPHLNWAPPLGDSAKFLGGPLLRPARKSEHSCGSDGSWRSTCRPGPAAGGPAAWAAV